MNAKGIDKIAKIIVSELKFINTRKANMQRIAEYIRANFIETLPEAIGLFFVLLTLLSKFLSAMSLIIHPADLIKIDPNKNKIE